jgi:hypothetical protein
MIKDQGWTDNERQGMRDRERETETERGPEENDRVGLQLREETRRETTGDTSLLTMFRFGLWTDWPTD